MGLRSPSGRGAFFSAVVGAAGVAALVIALREPPTALERAARALRGRARAGDVVLAVGCAAPSDADRFAPAHALCVGKHALPLALLGRFRRVLVAGESPTLATLLRSRFGPPALVGPTLRAFPTRPVAFDLRDSLDRATVTRGGDVCPRRGRRHVCPGTGWRTVEPREVVVGGEPVECVFAHPSEDGLAIEVPLPAGVSSLRGVAGLSDRAAARHGGPTVTVRTLVDGRPVARLVVENRKGLRAWSATVPDEATTLRVEVVTPSQGARSFCLQAWGS